MSKEPVFVAVGGGKGGVGKSLISSAVATGLALAGRSTVCVDLDLGGANLHTFFGLRGTEKGIGDFLFRPTSRNLKDYGAETDVPNLTLIPGSGFIPGIANLYYFQKLKILRALKRLESDFVVLDLGAGTNYNVIDFFSITRSGIVVTNPEPTAILNAYEFIKNVLFRVFSRSFKQGHIALEIIEAHKFGENQQQGSSVRDLLEQLYQVDESAAKKVKAICRQFKPSLVLNMVKSMVHSHAIASNLIDICSNFLEIELRYLGAVPRDETVSKQILRLKNVMLSSPDSPAAKAISGLTKKCLAGFKDQTLILHDEADRETDKHKVGSSLETTGSEKGDLDSMLRRFFKEFGVDESGADEWLDKQTVANTSALSILDPKPRVEQDLMVPVFEKEKELDLRNFEIPTDKRQLLTFIAQLANLEKELEEMGSAKGHGISTKEIADAWFKTGLVLIESGQFSTALRSFDRAAWLEKDYTAAHLNAACCLMILGRNKDALERLNKAEPALYPDQESLNRTLHINRALAFFLSGDYENTIKSIEKLGNHFLDQEKGLHLKAHCLFYLGSVDEAASLWERCAAPLSKHNMAVCMVYISKFEEALKALKNFLQQNRNDALANALSSLCLFHLKSYGDALEYLDRALSLEPFNVKIRALSAFIAFKTGQLDRAIKEADVIAKLRPSNPSLLKLVEDIKTGLKI